MRRLGRTAEASVCFLVIGKLAALIALGQEQSFSGDLCWGGPVQGASHSQVARAARADFSGACRLFTVDETVGCNPDPAQPHAGEVWFYLVRGESWGEDSLSRERSVACDRWSGVARSSRVARTTRGHRVGIVCHNCYFDENPDPFLDLTLTKDYIDQALLAGADAIELDLRFSEAAHCLAPDIEVRHAANEGPCLTAVLGHGPLRSADSLLFVEAKEVPTDTELTELLCLFLPSGEEVDAVCGDLPRYPEYAAAARPLVLRALWGRREFVTRIHDKLRQRPFDLLRDRVRLHLLFSKAHPATYDNIDIWSQWVDGFEFDYTDDNLFSKIVYARSLGLAVAVFGNEHYCTAEMYVASLREEVDFLVVEYPAGMARRIVEEDNRLLYLNVWDQYRPWVPDTAGNPHTVSYWGPDSATPSSLEVDLGGAPALVYRSRADAEEMFGAVLEFDGTRFLRFSDDLGEMDNWSCGGYLVAAVVNHEGGSGTQRDIVSKTEESGFHLDLNAGLLRFGVHVGGAYRTATLDDGYLANGNSYLIVGAYDGHDNVRLWINDVLETGASDVDHHGGVETNDLPLLIGADPDGGGGAGSFFAGRMQAVSVVAWGHHPAPPDRPRRYGGGTAATCSRVPRIDVEKAINAVDPSAPTRGEDADCPPGPRLPSGSPVVFSYLVTNPGNTAIDMSDVAVRDDNGTPEDSSDDFEAWPVLSGSHNVGDVDGDGSLDVGETWRYEYRTTAFGTSHLSEVTVDPPGNPSDCDRNHYSGP